MPNLKNNISYSLLLACADIVLPFVVFSYVSRVLGPANVGIVNFIDSIASYFTLFSMMGISVMGVRQIARCQGNPSRLRNSFFSLLSLNALMCLLMIALMIVLTFCVPQLRRQPLMMSMAVAKVVLNMLLIEWFYKGIENFRYITIRSVAIRVAYVIAVCMLVNVADQYKLYYLLTVAALLLNALVNIIHARRWISLTDAKINIRSLLKPFFSLGVQQILAASISVVNIIILGFACGHLPTGYYSSAFKIYSIALGIYVAFSYVILPRISSLLIGGESGAAHALVKINLKCVLTIIPVIIAITEIFAPQIVRMVLGDDYSECVGLLRILMPGLLAGCLNQIMVLQILIPKGEDRRVACNYLATFVVVIILDLAIIPHGGAQAAAIITLIGEFFLFILSISSSRKIFLNLSRS